MRTSDFDFELPPGSIAQHPAPRGTSRLLVLDRRGRRLHRSIADLPRLLAPGDLLVVNNTRVLAARLFARREVGGGRVELLLVDQLAECRWQALARPARRLRPGETLRIDGGPSVEILEVRPGGRILVAFPEPIEPHLERIGHVPLPPYIRRPDEARDRHDYQTLFARRDGAVAAPTAGLHFTPALLERLARRGVRLAELTLHVGIGTFRPITAEAVADHEMDSERFELPPETVAAVAATRERGGRVVAVGTTVVRTLEAVAARHDGGLQATRDATDLFIAPGFAFRVVDLLLTNFHLPRSSLLLLVSAFAGRDRVLAAYREAIERGYRFYSYGDAMLLERRSG